MATVGTSTAGLTTTPFGDAACQISITKIRDFKFNIKATEVSTIIPDGDKNKQYPGTRMNRVCCG